MNTLPPWQQFENAVRELDWIRATQVIVHAERISVAALARRDSLRPCVVAAALFGPPGLVLWLRSKVFLGGGSGVAGTAPWSEKFVRAMFARCVSDYAAALTRPRWLDVGAAFERVVTVPRLSIDQDIVVDCLATDLVEVGVQVESQLPYAVRDDADLGRLGNRTERLLRRLTGGWRLRIVAEAIRQLSNAAQYSHLRNPILLDALQRLSWPTLRHFAWLATMPLQTDARWDAALLKPIVRAVTMPPEDEDFPR